MGGVVVGVHGGFGRCRGVGGGTPRAQGLDEGPRSEAVSCSLPGRSRICGALLRDMAHLPGRALPCRAVERPAGERRRLRTTVVRSPAGGPAP
ncbi:hypothetical protein [Blastococcus brunescens]|uniref:Uncharacterized protein n=1 Tax=Blastococcus brunescens TaxID=1564165 RepID=A0ABZ1AZT7_9ACTN|nr:hypothetical protein [Blastococcus sp. BMG 8361]WRL63016.1 hypothetical protein U6N30_24680 [Blastococcus sp. BMG 8361]